MKRQKSILVIDDESAVGEIIKEMLEPHYEEVVYISSPAQAKEVIKDRAFSMIISDINMPELMGDQLVRYVRSFGRLEPIIFITGHATRDVLVSALRLGVSDVIEKPIECSMILESIDRIFELEKRKQQIYMAGASANESAVEDDNLRRQKKIVGLLHVVADQKKSN